MNRMILIAATLAAMAPAAALSQGRHASLPRGKPETLHVSAINLDDQDGTTFTLKDVAGVKLEPVKVPLAICRKDHLGRLLPGLDVDMIVETKRDADGKPVRYVRPERFRPWCN